MIMRMSEDEIIGFAMFSLGIFAQFCETWWFGWNKLLATLGEFTADIVCQTLWIVGLIVMMIRIVTGKQIGRAHV